jgi:hypothetical protein
MPDLKQNPEGRKIPLLVWLCVGVAALLLLCFACLMVAAGSEFTQPEGIVATQIRHFSEGGGLYFGLKDYPYTVCAYMPLFYSIVAGLAKLGIPVLLAGRCVSWLALLGILWLLGRIVAIFGLGTSYQLLAMGLGGLTQLLLSWGSTGQVDMLAVAFSLAAYYCYLRFARLGEAALDAAAWFSFAALMTKQTALIAPLAIFVCLLGSEWGRAARFAVISGGSSLFVVLGLNWALEGRFLANTLFANINPFALYKLQQPLEYFGVVLMGLAVVVLVGLPAARRQGWQAPFVYLGLALGWSLFASAKVGADSNYLLESACLLIVCGVLGLAALDFFGLLAAGSRSWVTLLALPLGLYVVQNGRVAVSALAQRFEREARFSAQADMARPLVSGSRRVLSADSNLMVQAGRPLEVEPLIYRLLVEAGRIDPQPVLRDIEAAAFETIVLYDNVQADTVADPEIPRLPAEQMAAVARRYELVQHAPGPNLSGLYIYKPKPLVRRQ